MIVSEISPIKHKNLGTEIALWHGDIAYYYHKAYLLKAGLILCCGIARNYITWNGISKAGREKFSHRQKDCNERVLMVIPLARNKNRCNKESSTPWPRSKSSYGRVARGRHLV